MESKKGIIISALVIIALLIIAVPGAHYFDTDSAMVGGYHVVYRSHQNGGYSPIQELGPNPALKQIAKIPNVKEVSWYDAFGNWYDWTPSHQVGTPYLGGKIVRVCLH